MRFLLVTGGTAATVFALTPLATALRNAGHEIFMAANENLVPAIAGNGIPAVGITTAAIQDFMFSDGSGRPVTIPPDARGTLLHVGRSFARMAEATLDALLELAGDWRPDMIIGGANTYAAGLAAARIGVPYVRHTWDLVETAEMDEGATEVLAPRLRALGLDGYVRPDLLVDICPPGLTKGRAPEALPMRWAPGNHQRRLERWMYTRGSGRYRALVTAGTRGGPFTPRNAGLLRKLTDALATLDAEVLVASPDDVAEGLRAELDGVRVGWIPLDVVMPTCDVILHHGGGVTAMTAMKFGTPQIIAPKDAYQVAAARPIADFGAGAVLAPEEDSADRTVRLCQEILSDPAYRARSRILAAQIAALPSPAEAARVLERCAAR